MKAIILLIFLGILVSLGSALVQLVRDDRGTDGMVRALSWRIGLSVVLFILLLLLRLLRAGQPRRGRSHRTGG